MGNADVTSIADLYDRLWVVGIAKSAADTRYDGPGLSDNASSRWNKQSGLDNVNAIREVGDFAVGGVGSQDGVEGGRVIR